MPSSNFQDIEIFDKLIHFVFYAVFSFFLFFLSYNLNFGLDTLIKKWTFVLTIGTLLGFTVEWIQYTLIPSRSGDCLDLLANTIGLIGMLFVIYLLKRFSVL